MNRKNPLLESKLLIAIDGSKATIKVNKKKTIRFNLKKEDQASAFLMLAMNFTRDMTIRSKMGFLKLIS